MTKHLPPWIYKKKQAEHLRRSKAAKRGWQTRRRGKGFAEFWGTTEKQKRRSEASKKGWVKRRLHLRPELLRSGYGMHHIPIETNTKPGNYFGMLIVMWSRDESEHSELRSRLLDKFEECAAEYLGYSLDDWVYTFTSPEYAPPMPSNGEDSNEGKWEFVVEGPNGAIVFMRSGNIENL